MPDPNQPLLSVLIPAYEYVAGVKEILDSIAGSVTDRIEVIIFDDSRTGHVEDMVRAHEVSKKVVYCRNRPGLGAIANWNALLREAKGSYVLLLHHDEWPMGENFFGQIVERIEAEPKDIFLLDLYFSSVNDRYLYMGMPAALRLFVVRYIPAYLYRRNVLGAPSVVVLRRDFAVQFDPRLPRLVDVDWYVRIFERHPNVGCLTGLGLRTVEHAGSITGSIRNEIQQRKKMESVLLLQERPGVLALRINAAGDAVSRCLAWAEIAVWAVVKLATRVLALFSVHLRRGRWLGGAMCPAKGQASNAD